MSRRQTTTFLPFFGPEGIGGGLSSENPIVVSPSKMVVADNILVDTVLSRKKRGGLARYNTGTQYLTASYPRTGTMIGAAPIRGGVEFFRRNLSGVEISDVFVHQGSAVWSIEDRNTIGINRTGTAVLSTNGVPSYQVFNDTLYFTTTTTSDLYRKWDGNTAAITVATAPADGPGKYLRAHQGRMWMAGNPDFPFRLYYSSALEPEQWGNTPPFDGGSLDLIEDGEPAGITAIFPSFQGRLYVSTRRAIYEITGFEPADFVIQTVSRGVGCLAHSAVVAAANDVFFASDRGIHSLRQIESGRITETQFLSRDIQRLWRDLVNPAAYSQVNLAYDENINCVKVSVPTSGTTQNETVLCYNIEFGIWMAHQKVFARSMWPVLVGNAQKIAYGREDGEIVVSEDANKTDLGQTYTTRFTTGIIYGGQDFGVQKLFKSITVLCSSATPSSLDITWDIDGIRGGTRSVQLFAAGDKLGTTLVLGSSRLGVGQYVPQTVTMNDIGFGIQITVSMPGNSDIEFYGMILEVEDANPQFS